AAVTDAPTAPRGDVTLGVAPEAPAPEAPVAEGVAPSLEKGEAVMRKGAAGGADSPKSSANAPVPPPPAAESDAIQIQAPADAGLGSQQAAPAPAQQVQRAERPMNAAPIMDDTRETLDKQSQLRRSIRPVARQNAAKEEAGGRRDRSVEDGLTSHRSHYRME